ncbi:hypothetical protein [Aquamicrobium sp. LC103]|uniref:hypothetical protein n=1 Tax=Aquamicrobium sp. LC103 TaxID=1120658 RepID=UPI00063EADF8|nr:hypothetical protein [Aquamicrobium sp. LC103]TKT69694.1 hypothetical protein XW59_026525 [Aquamicrobium sp. LC103]
MMRRIANLGIIGLAALVCYGMQISKPRYADLIGPIPVHGSMGENVEARLFDVTIEKVEFANELAIKEFGEEKTLTTSGLWAIITTGLGASTTSTTVGSATWQGPTGLRYNHTKRLSNATGLPPLAVEPGLPARGRFVFEIPPSQVNGATLLVSNRSYFALDSEARVALDQLDLKPDGTPETVIPVYDMNRPVQGRSDERG